MLSSNGGCRIEKRRWLGLGGIKGLGIKASIEAGIGENYFKKISLGSAFWNGLKREMKRKIEACQQEL